MGMRQVRRYFLISLSKSSLNIQRSSDQLPNLNYSPSWVFKYFLRLVHYEKQMHGSLDRSMKQLIRSHSVYIPAFCRARPRVSNIIHKPLFLPASAPRVPWKQGPAALTPQCKALYKGPIYHGFLYPTGPDCTTSYQDLANKSHPDPRRTQKFHLYAMNTLSGFNWNSFPRGSFYILLSFHTMVPPRHFTPD
jgi:hypothetical protein